MSTPVSINGRAPIKLGARARVEVEKVPVLLFSAGGHRFAIEAGAVSEVCERDFKASDSRRVQIDLADAVGLFHAPAEHWLVLKPGHVLLSVSQVERITVLPRLMALPGLFQGAERDWYKGLLSVEDEVIPLLRSEYWQRFAESRR